MQTDYDAIVLGAGPAGLTAGIYLSRARAKTLIVDTGTVGGQMILSWAVANYPGVPETQGRRIAKTMRDQAESFGCTILSNSDVLNLDLAGPVKKVTVEDEGTVTARAVIIATGGVPRTLGIPSETQFKGRGISYCATCDGDFFTDQDIAVIGGGNSALEEAVSLTKYASSVTIVHEFDHFQAQPWAVEEAKKNPKIRYLMEQDIQGFEGGEHLEQLVVSHKRTGEVTKVPVTGCFIFIGYQPNTTELKGVVDLNERGEIITDGDLRTNVPGVFAAGDARVKRYRQITTAVADGTIAALSAVDYLTSTAD
ncbi:MAG: FAD-dependent oxidoreductase [Deltaproteobacteria bacterium]|nr:FAD-dependent oxidoreductase [Deltaproteobacteria bacterium]